MNLYPSNQSQKEILVIDDTPDNLRLLSAILTQHNYEIRKALNSSQAIASVQAEAPDLILLDIKMPGMNGFDVCTALKQNSVTQDIPVIFISALDDALDKVRAFSVGGADYITKPFQEAEVLARIENQLKIVELQGKLKTQNEALEKSNQALEQFAYVVAHDLQQPLQSIIGYAKIIDLKYSEILDISMKNYLTKISDAGGRMQFLIRDLLSYALIEKGGIEFSKIDGNIALKQALNNIEFLLQASHAELIYPTLPTLLGHETQLIQLFQNIVGNATKFSRSNVPLKIEISVSQYNQEYWLFGVHDNGMGISSENLGRIFELFQRVDGDGDIPGTGLGLAICKKIVESHGGQIWATSKLHVGTTFLFTLPIVQGEP